MFKKGERVECQIKGEPKYGVVSKGGKVMITVIEDGGEHQIKGHYSQFTLSNHPLPKDEPSEMDRYSLRSYREINSHGDSRTFGAVILENGTPIMHVRNDGHGGSNEYEPYDYKICDGEVEKRFFATVKSWATKFGYADMIEADDTWVEWWQHERPHGVMAKDYIADMKKIGE